MFEKILIANRGEIALRIVRACREMGIRTVVVHSKVDEYSLPVRFADEAICIGSASTKESYLHVPSIISAAEICDGHDDDCDGVPDEDCISCTWGVPGDHATIQQAIDAADPGDVVCIDAGLYEERLTLAYKSLSLVAPAGPPVRHRRRGARSPGLGGRARAPPRSESHPPRCRRPHGRD